MRLGVSLAWYRPVSLAIYTCRWTLVCGHVSLAFCFHGRNFVDSYVAGTGEVPECGRKRFDWFLFNA